MINSERWSGIVAAIFLSKKLPLPVGLNRKEIYYAKIV